MTGYFLIKTGGVVITMITTDISYRGPPEIIVYTRCKYFDPCYARATVVRARFLAAAFSDGSYLAHVNGAYLRHVTFCIVRDPLCSSSRLSLSVGPLAYAACCPLTVPSWSKVHDGDFEGVEQTCSRIQPASPILAVM